MSHALTADFEMLYEDNQPKVYRLALGLAGNPHDAEEITQEAFLRAFRSYRDFRGECSFFHLDIPDSRQRYQGLPEKKK